MIINYYSINDQLIETKVYMQLTIYSRMIAIVYIGMEVLLAVFNFWWWVHRLHVQPPHCIASSADQQPDVDT